MEEHRCADVQYLDTLGNQRMYRAFDVEVFSYNI